MANQTYVSGETLSFAALREVNVARCEGWHPLEDWSECDWMTATLGELGEAANLVKKRRRAPFMPKREPGITDDDLADELADAIIYMDLLAARVGIDLGAAVRRKFNAISERYGVEFRL